MPAQCRIAPSLGTLAGHPNDVWGTVDYTDTTQPTVFFGLYGLPDFYELWRHTGKKWILWAGSDIRHFEAGYWLEEGGGIRLDYRSLAKWINKHCENWVENIREQEALHRVGIHSQICPSFMGNVDDYPVSYTPNKKYYASVSGDDFALYGWGKVEGMAKRFPDFEFHLYGNRKPWTSKNPNVFVHGRVPEDTMNSEIQHMQGGLRLVEFDGFSEILAKSVLWGQWPVSVIPYQHILQYEPEVKDEPNIQGREYYRRVINQYPWNAKNN